MAVGFSTAADGRMLGAGAGGCAAAAVIDVAGVSRGTRVGSFGSGIVASARRSDSLIVPNVGAGAAGFVAVAAGLVGVSTLLVVEAAGFGRGVVVAAALAGTGAGWDVGAAVIVFAGAVDVAAGVLAAVVVVAGTADFAGGAASLLLLPAAGVAASALTPGGCCETATLTEGSCLASVVAGGFEDLVEEGLAFSATGVVSAGAAGAWAWLGRLRQASSSDGSR